MSNVPMRLVAIDQVASLYDEQTNHLVYSIFVIDVLKGADRKRGINSKQYQRIKRLIYGIPRIKSKPQVGILVVRQ